MSDYQNAKAQYDKDFETYKQNLVKYVQDKLGGAWSASQIENLIKNAQGNLTYLSSGNKFLSADLSGLETVSISDFDKYLKYVASEAKKNDGITQMNYNKHIDSEGRTIWNDGYGGEYWYSPGITPTISHADSTSDSRFYEQLYKVKNGSSILYKNAIKSNDGTVYDAKLVFDDVGETPDEYRYIGLAVDINNRSAFLLGFENLYNYHTEGHWEFYKAGSKTQTTIPYLLVGVGDLDFDQDVLVKGNVVGTLNGSKVTIDTDNSSYAYYRDKGTYGEGSTEQDRPNQSFTMLKNVDTFSWSWLPHDIVGTSKVGYSNKGMPVYEWISFGAADLPFDTPPVLKQPKTVTYSLNDVT
ncbi:hypothetical protein, partial [Ligilactobacillus equi]|uniref:hypothetical protein n=2 Tax=Ligilactobacillus equi TaxID=137357 RepID=UPI00138ACE77